MRHYTNFGRTTFNTSFVSLGRSLQNTPFNLPRPFYSRKAWELLLPTSLTAKNPENWPKPPTKTKSHFPACLSFFFRILAQLEGSSQDGPRNWLITLVSFRPLRIGQRGTPSNNGLSMAYNRGVES